MAKSNGKKVVFPKTSLAEIFDCNEHEICGLDPAQEKDRLTISFWKNPSKLVLQSLIQFMLATDTELRTLDESEKEALLADFYYALSEIVLDTNIEGLDFSTPEKAQEMFLESPGLPMGFVYEAVAAWLLKLLQEGLELKKTLSLLTEPRSSGQKGNETEQK